MPSEVYSLPDSCNNEFVVVKGDYLRRLEDAASDQYSQKEQDDAWSKGASVAKRDLVALIQRALDEDAWVYTEANQDKIEELVADMDIINDQLVDLQAKMNAWCDNIRTLR